VTPNHITPGAATAAPTTTEEESQNMADNDRRIKVTGYYTPDDDSAFDPDHETGVSAEMFDRLSEEFMSLEDLEAEAEEN